MFYILFKPNCVPIQDELWCAYMGFLTGKNHFSKVVWILGVQIAVRFYRLLINFLLFSFIMFHLLMLEDLLALRQVTLRMWSRVWYWALKWCSFGQLNVQLIVIWCHADQIFVCPPTRCILLSIMLNWLNCLMCLSWLLVGDYQLFLIGHANIQFLLNVHLYISFDVIVYNCWTFLIIIIHYNVSIFI